LSTARQARKRTLEQIQAAVAELYFHERYEEALGVLDGVLAQGGFLDGLEEKDRGRLREWRGKVAGKVQEKGKGKEGGGRSDGA
jgi:hypothetical protein